MSEYPQVPGDAYELRFTLRALADLGADACSPGDLDAVRDGTPWPAIVDKFAGQRAIDPRGTEPPLHGMGVPDVDALHGPAGQRAATWYDQDLGVVWFLGFTAEHDYTLLERRAAEGDLLPCEDDEVVLELDLENRDFFERVGPGVEKLIVDAWQQPGQTQRGTVGGDVLRLDVVIDDAALGDVFICVRLPFGPGAQALRDWPAGGSWNGSSSRWPRARRRPTTRRRRCPTARVAGGPSRTGQNSPSGWLV